MPNWETPNQIRRVGIFLHMNKIIILESFTNMCPLHFLNCTKYRAKMLQCIILI